MCDDSPQPALFLDVELLIEEVKKRSVLWDRFETEYNDRFTKVQLWEEVYEVLFDDWKDLGGMEKRIRAEEVKKKWRNLRDTYAKELAIEKKARKGKMKRKRPYRYLKQLSFLNRIFVEKVAEKEEDSSTDASEDERKKAKSKPCNGEISLEQLIQEVKSRPILWNKQIQAGERTERDIRYRHWEEISSIIFEDWHELGRAAKSLRCVEVKKKWRNLRDSFCRELGNQRAVEMGTRRPKRPYRFTNELAFLQGHLGRQGEDDYAVMDNPVTLEIEAARSSYSLSDLEDTVEVKPAKVAKAAKTKEIQEIQVKTYDEDVCFAEMLVPMLKKLNDDQKHYAQVKILNVLRRARQFDPLESIPESKTKAVVVIKNENL